MIIFFSGTGNTKHCATMLAKLLGEQLMPLSVSHLSDPRSAHISSEDGRVIWMFPTYSWGIPVRLAQLMKYAHFDFAADAVHWMVTTCGDDIGCTADQWRKIFAHRGCKTATAFSVQMPNTYTFMKGYDVDSFELAEAKVFEAQARVEYVAQVIGKGEKIADMVTRGKFPWIKSHIIYHYFNKFCTSPKPFTADDKCTKCGLCQRTCPMDNISPNNGKPMWGENCLLCSRCYHICPHQAVQYGKQTRNKGQHRLFVTHLTRE
jgi:NAD-dependent dihydropyrimidine dehydrogenase PreA subunit